MNYIVEIIYANILLFYALLAWSVIWKGIALWHAARNNQLAWYVAILIINTAGIFEIIYLIFFRKQKYNRYK